MAVKKKKTPAPSRAILVLGMHRSGTSAAARLCNLLGAELGNDLLAASEGNNDRGFWEHAGAVALHERLLERLGAGWDDPLPLLEDWRERADVKPFAAELAALLRRDFSAAPLWCVKDPRLCLTLPLWRDALARLNTEPLYLLILRHPSQVAESLGRRDGFPREKSLLLWTVYMLEAEQASRGGKRAFIFFDDLRDNWRAAMGYAADRFGISWPVAPEQAAREVESFLDPALVHHKGERRVACDRGDVAEWAERTWLALLKLARQEDKSAHAECDSIRAEISGIFSPSAWLGACRAAETRRWRGEVAALSDTLHRRDLDLAAALEKTHGLERKLDEVAREKTKALEKYAESERYARALKGHLELILRSRSWKITAPLRQATRLWAMRRALAALATYRKLYGIWAHYGLRGVIQKIRGEVLTAPGGVMDLTEWFGRYRPDALALETMRARAWPENAPLFTVLMCAYNTREDWLREAIASVRAQVYPEWELVCVDDGSSAPHVARVLEECARLDARVKFIRLPENRGVSAASNAGLTQAVGDYVCFLDHDDALEPQALYRFAEAALRDSPDLLYSDEVSAGAEDLSLIEGISLHPQFSLDYYLSHPYFVHLVGVRCEILKEIGGFDETFPVSQDVDLILRALLKANKITHVADILYRWRSVAKSLGHERKEQVESHTMRAISRYLAAAGYGSAEVRKGESFNFYDIRYKSGAPEALMKVAIIIPTKNRVDLLRTCIESLRATVLPELADIHVVDHESGDGETVAYLHVLEKEGVRVLPHSGPFNFSAINNAAVARLEPGKYTHYLFLNNDIEAINPGWLESMLDLASRPEAGIVGAVLLYPDMRIQHGGVIVGLHGAAEHAHKFDDFRDASGARFRGFGGALLAAREMSAVTAACLLMRADAFAKISGYDEKLAVGFGDTDLCLRAVEAGYKVLMDGRAVLIHHESVSRGKGGGRDPHPKDSKLFRARYARMLEEGDPYYHQLLARDSSQFDLESNARCPLQTSMRTVSTGRTARSPDSE